MNEVTLGTQKARVKDLQAERLTVKGSLLNLPQPFHIGFHRTFLTLHVHSLLSLRKSQDIKQRSTGRYNKIITPVQLQGWGFQKIAL